MNSKITLNIYIDILYYGTSIFRSQRHGLKRRLIRGFLSMSFMRAQDFILMQNDVMFGVKDVNSG